MAEKVMIELGALAAPIAAQLREHGYRLPKSARHLQRLADCITDLKIAGVLSDAEGLKARMRLLKQITKAAVPQEPTP